VGPCSVAAAGPGGTSCRLHSRIAAIYSDSWISFGGQPLKANIVPVSVLGALSMYVVSMLALFSATKTEPHLKRPFRARQYQFAPFWTLTCTGVCVANLVYHTRPVAVLFAGLLAVGYLG